MDTITFPKGPINHIDTNQATENYENNMNHTTQPSSPLQTIMSSPAQSQRMHQSEYSIVPSRVKEKSKTYNNNTTKPCCLPPGAARLQDRNELAHLNDRLAHYLTEAKHMRNIPSHIDSTAFIQSIKVLEDGLLNLKTMYEQELDKARRYADNLSKEKNRYAMQVSKHQNGLQELEARLSDEKAKNLTLAEDVTHLHQALQQKDRQLEEITHDIKDPLQELSELRRQYVDILRENANLKTKSDTENFHRSEAEDQTEHLRQKMEFMESIHKQESLDLTNRLASVQETILMQEERVRDLTRPDNLLEDLVARVRSSADTEMTMYRQESEELFQRTVNVLKTRIDEDSRKVEELMGQNVKLTSESGEMLAHIRFLEGQVGSVEHQKSSLEEVLYRERNHARLHITSLERKLKDLSSLLIVKLRELNAARDAQIPIKMEVEAFRVLLEEEENRLRNLPEVSMNANNSHSTPMSHLQAPKYPDSKSHNISDSLTRNPPNSQDGPSMVLGPDLTVPRLGPVRARSAPSVQRLKGSATSRVNLISSGNGQGRDYFDQMFKDLKQDIRRSYDKQGIPESNAEDLSIPSPYDRPNKPDICTPLSSQRMNSSRIHDSNVYSSSSTGPIRILEVQQDGKFVRIMNTATTKDEEFGNFLLQQNVGGQPVAVYRFPPRLRVSAGNTLTIWAGTSEPSHHQPPTDFIFKEQAKWGTGPQCTTILCKPNGQAIAWTTAAHRFSSDPFETPGMLASCTTDKFQKMKSEELTELSHQVGGPQMEPAFLRREKELPPSLSPQKHPHGTSPPTAVHPNAGPPRIHNYGNDNSSLNRQSRSQGSRPHPVLGMPCAGPSGQRMGSAILRGFGGSSKGKIDSATKKLGQSFYGIPTPFLNPKQQEIARSHDSRSSPLVKFSL